MKRKFIFSLALIVLVMCLFSCGKTNEGENEQNKDKEIIMDMEKLAGEVLEKSPFTEEVVERKLDDNAQYGFIYGFEKTPKKVVSYIGGGATPQELLLIEAENEDDAKEIKTSLDNYRDKQITIYEPYAANEVPNLENAVINRNGVYVVYCVSAEDVSSAINKYFKSRLHLHEGYGRLKQLMFSLCQFYSKLKIRF